MSSDGELLHLKDFSRLKRLLSGLAGEVVGYTLTSWEGRWQACDRVSFYSFTLGAGFDLSYGPWLVYASAFAAVGFRLVYVYYYPLLHLSLLFLPFLHH
jgi:hypothetical protein